MEGTGADAYTGGTIGGGRLVRIGDDRAGNAGATDRPSLAAPLRDGDCAEEKSGTGGGSGFFGDAVSCSADVDVHENEAECTAGENAAKGE